MAKKMRRVIKKRKRVFHGKRNFYARHKRVVGIAKSLTEHFPPALRTRLTCTMSFGINNNTAVSDGNAFYLAFRGNGLIASGPNSAKFNSAWVGYSNNYPAGLAYLLANYSPGPGIDNQITGPYAKYLVIKSWIKFQLYPEATAMGFTNVNTRIVVVPVAYDIGTQIVTQAVGNWIEQPYAKYKVCPTELVTSPLTIKHVMSTKKILGINKNVTTDDTTFTGTYITDPSSAWTWFIAINNLNTSNTNTQTFSGEAVVTYDVIFFDRNTLSSYAPT